MTTRTDADDDARKGAKPTSPTRRGNRRTRTGDDRRNRRSSTARSTHSARRRSTAKLRADPRTTTRNRPTANTASASPRRGRTHDGIRVQRLTVRSPNGDHLRVPTTARAPRATRPQSRRRRSKDDISDDVLSAGLRSLTASSIRIQAHDGTYIDERMSARGSVAFCVGQRHADHRVGRSGDA